MFLDAVVIAICAVLSTLLGLLPTFGLYDFETFSEDILPGVIQMMQYYNAFADTVPYVSITMDYFLLLIVFEICLFVLKLILGSRHPYST